MSGLFYLEIIMKIACKQCRELKEYYAKGLCRECYNRKYREENLGKIKANNRKHYLKNSEKYREYYRKRIIKNPGENKARAKKYHAENPEKVRESLRKHRIKNLEKIKTNNREYYLKNSVKIKAKWEKWKKENPEKVREQKLRRYGYGEAKKGVVGRVITENILKYGILTCEKCKEQCLDNFHIDHIRPVSKGGLSDYDNLQILCADCNRRKHVDITDYRQSIENNQMFLKTIGG